MKIKKCNYVELFTFLAFITLGFFLHFCNYDNSVFALTEYEENFFAQNDNLFYEPCEDGGDSTGDGTIKISGDTPEEKVWSGLTSFLSEEQAAGIMGNIGGRENTTFGPTIREHGQTGNLYERGVQLGYGLIQWSFGRRVDLLKYIEKKDSSLTEYLENDEYILSGKDFIAKVGHDVANKIYMYEIEFLKHELDTNKTYNGYYKVTGDYSGAATWFCKNIEVPQGYDSGECEGAPRVTKAKEYYEKFAGKTIVGNGEKSAGSGISTKTLTSSVHDKAWELANQTKEQAFNGPTAEYTDAIKSVGGDTGGGDKWAREGMSCDMFVATVLKASGVDNEVPWGAVGKQAEYFASHPEIYKEVEGDPTDSNTYQPGDIRIKGTSHIEIFGQKDGENYILAASHPDLNKKGEVVKSGRYAGYQEFYSEGKNYKIYRTAGKSTCEGQGNNNIAQTALDLAWPIGTSSSKYKYPGGSATDEYLKAAKKTKVKYEGEDGTDCSYFVETVARYSGADESFDADATDDYAKNSSEWEVIEWDKNDWDKGEQIESGDIIHCHKQGNAPGNYNQHFYILVEQDGELVRVDASRGSKYGLVSKDFHYKHAGSCVKQYIIRSKNAKNTVKDSGGGDSSLTASASKINELAVEYAWPKGDDTYKSRANNAFKEAIDSITSHQGADGWDHGKSCVVFARTVLIKAGALKSKKVVIDVEPTRQQIIRQGNFKEIIPKNPKDPDEYQPGDAVFYWSNEKGRTSHVAIAVEIDGKMYLSQASYKTAFGHISKFSAYKDKTYIYRYKYAGDDCDPCPDEENNGNGELKDGGYTSAKEANEAVMKEYKSLNNSEAKSKYHIDTGCDGILIKNCPSFVKYFVNKYTSVTWTGATGNGSQTADILAKEYNLESSKTPKVYAVFSVASGITMCGSVKCGHTGVVLGINKAANKIIIGEAGCSSSLSWIGAHEYDLSKFSDGSYTYAYLDSILKSGGLK